jgi:hypothetical protein
MPVQPARLSEEIDIYRQVLAFIYTQQKKRRARAGLLIHPRHALHLFQEIQGAAALWLDTFPQQDLAGEDACRAAGADACFSFVSSRPRRFALM